MNDWKAQLATFFQLHEQEEQQQHEQHDPLRSSQNEGAIEEFMVAVAAPAFEEFGAVLKEHGRHIRLRLGDSNMRIISEFAGTEEFDYTLWAGVSALSAESRTGGKRTPDSFHNAKGTGALADTTKDDIVRRLVDRYITLTTPRVRVTAAGDYDAGNIRYGTPRNNGITASTHTGVRSRERSHAPDTT